MRSTMRRQSRFAQWLVIVFWSLFMVLLGLVLAHLMWDAGEAWAEMPAHGTWSPQAGQVMDELGIRWQPEPFVTNDLPPWESWSVHDVPIRGSFAPKSHQGL